MNAPRTVTISIAVVAGFLFLATAAATVTGVSLLFPSPIWDGLWNLNPRAREGFLRFGVVAGPLLLALGGVTCAAGIGFLRRRKWAWIVALALFAVNGAGDLVTLVWAHDLVRGGSGILIAGGFLFLLTRPGIRGSFD